MAMLIYQNYSEGVQCNSSGSLIAKPCTPAEIAFYESSAQHPVLQNYMPTFMGTLSSNSEQQSLLAGIQNAGELSLQTSGVSSSTDTASPATPELSAVPGVTTIPASIPQQEAPWVPSGGKKIESGVSIVLENVASGFQRPSVLDVKLGSRLWADDAPLSKRAKLDAVSKETTSSSLGFRIAGMKVWAGDGDKNETPDKKLDEHEKVTGGVADGEAPKGKAVEKDGYKRYDKWYGRTLNDQNVKEGFTAFLAAAKTGKADYSKLVAKRLASDLQRIQAALESEESRMYSASILIIYESDPTAFEKALEDERTRENEEAEDEDGGDAEDGLLEVVDLQAGGGNIEQGSLTFDLDSAPTELADIIDEDEDEPLKVHDVRLIDFAHASWTPGQGRDENALHGVRSVLRIVEEIANA